MKNVIIFLLVVFAVYPVTAQDETLFSGEIESGWYGGPLFKLGQVNGKTGYFVGGQGGWIINHRFVLGAKGYVLANPFNVEGLENVVVGFGCGGALLEYVIASNKLLHFSIESMIGAGGVYNDVKDYDKYHDRLEYSSDGCFVFEPGFNVVLNVMKNFRMGVGVIYRYVNGISYDAGTTYRTMTETDYRTISDSDLNGVSVQIIFKFGKF